MYAGDHQLRGPALTQQVPACGEPAFASGQDHDRIGRCISGQVIAGDAPAETAEADQRRHHKHEGYRLQ